LTLANRQDGQVSPPGLAIDAPAEYRQATSVGSPEAGDTQPVDGPDGGDRLSITVIHRG
jgi:hypothetical protein